MCSSDLFSGVCILYIGWCVYFVCFPVTIWRVMYVNLFILVLLLLFAFVLGAVSVLLYQFIRRYRYLKAWFDGTHPN